MYPEIRKSGNPEIRISAHDMPHQKLRGGGISTPKTPFRLICTTKSEPSVKLDLYYNEWFVVDICRFPVDGFDTR